MGADYPYERLEKHWQTVLLQQFHDILPGSSIAWVYRDAERNYTELATDLEDLIGRSLAELAGPGDRSITFNPTPHERDGVPALGAGAATEPDGSDVAVTEDGDRLTLDNGLLRVVVDGRGLLTSIVDLTTNRELVPPGGAANLLQLHRDAPNEWDAWDIDEHYRRHAVDLDEAESITVSTNSSDRATVRVARRHGGSTFLQDISLARGAASLEIVTTVDWHERQTLLKLAFPLAVQAPQSASETQFGHVFRPTHTNTSWEAAKFEICAHRWIHVAEPGFGVAVTNDRTYGHDVTHGGAQRWRVRDHGAAVAAAGAGVSGPGRRPGRARLPQPARARRGDRRRRARRLPDQPAGPVGARIARRRADRDGVRSGGGDRGGEARRGPVRRRDRPALRIARSAIHCDGDGRIPGGAGDRDRPAGAAGRRRCPNKRHGLGGRSTCHSGRSKSSPCGSPGAATRRG